MSSITEIANKLIEETNCTTAEAIEALAEANGDYEAALQFLREKNAQPINIVLVEKEESQKENQEEDEEKTNSKEEYTAKGKDILKLIKKLLKEGNVTKLTVKKKDEVVLNIPVNAAAIGVVLIPYLSILAGIAAIATDCTIQVERKGDVVVNVNDTLKNASDKVEKTVKDILDR
ncbi:uncharacterized protein DUF4342 [Alkalibaculum bacchi]|uniref:Uncharacterized protein DUF4342 n=1 Tax=Alkalibaculum bacchi TaxID=645887 RepID=A0A366IFQ4_9FIRM|nr:DUF4342 domain-containing protein [Alkalibaculum bacchi]RBP68907.1 uncharacterized protein DUF4342 [Alkalibaculum bacchi]